MLRNVLIIVPVLLVAAGLALRLMVATDPGTTQVEEVPGNDTLVVVIHGLPGPKSIDTLKEVIRRDLPKSDILTATYSASALSNIDPYRISNTIEHGINDADRKNNYARIILVGHSLGAVLLRKTLVWALDVEEDRESFGRQGRRRWPDKVVRFVSLAGINRGWSLDPRPSNMSLPTYMVGHMAEWVATLTGTGRLLSAVKRGAPFIADLRVQWIRIARQDMEAGGKYRLPLSIHLLGDIDDVVSREDGQDLAATKDARFMTLVNTGHVDIITELEKGNLASQRLQHIRAALILPEDQLSFDKLTVQGEDPSIKRIIYILHGIRDYGVWAEQLRSQIEKRKPADAVVTPPKYGYFPMVPFVLFWDRQKNVRKFMDEYTENLARFPHAKAFDFIGHSNGTYILASALQRYPTMRVNNVLFAGSVVPKHYPWRDLVDAGRVAKLHNIVATGDWVVALFPRLFEQIAEWSGNTSARGMLDIGSAGFRGFNDSGKADTQHRIVDTKFLPGTHGSALDLRDPKKMEAVVAFAVSGNEEQVMALRTDDPQWGWLDQLSNVAWIVWLGIAALLVLVGYVAAALFGNTGLVVYVLVMVGLLYSY